MRRAGAVVAAALMFMAPALADDRQPTDDVYGLHYCAPPIRPPCFRQNNTFAEPRALRACEVEADAFLRGVQRYRLCLSQEISRAVLDLNTALMQFRCASAARRLCQEGRATPAPPKPTPRKAPRDIPFVP